MLKRVWMILTLFLILTLPSCDKMTPETTMENDITPGPAEVTEGAVTSVPAGGTDIPEAFAYGITRQSYLDKEKEITITYPAVSGLKDEGLQKTVNENIKHDALKSLVNFGTDEEDCYLEIKYEVKWKSSRLLSIQFTGQEFHSGMLYPNDLYVTTNINMTSGEAVKLSDIVNINEDFVDSYKSRGKYTAPMTTEEPSFLDYIYGEPLAQMTPDNIGDKYFYFTEDSLGISTEAAHAMGGHAEYEIKYGELLDFVNQDNELWKDFSGVFTQVNQNAGLKEDLIRSLIPENWGISADTSGDRLLAEGDLNNDRIEDAAFIIEKEDSKKTANPRTLMIAFGREDGTYEVSLTDEDIILRADEGGIWGDPLDSIAVARGSLILNFYGGSSRRWENSYEFCYLKEAWYLARAEEKNLQMLDSGYSQGTAENYDFLNGEYGKTQTARDGTVSEVKEKLVLTELITLKEFDIRSADKYKSVSKLKVLTAFGEGGLYESKALGFSFIIPDGWGGKYTVAEDSDSLTVYFVPEDPSENIYGKFFTILDKSAPDYEGMFDYVGEPREFEAKGKTYVTGGPTDAGFPDIHAEFEDYRKMREDIPSILETIQPLTEENEAEPDFSLEEIRQFLLLAVLAVDEIADEEIMGSRVIGKIDNSIVIESIGDYPAFDNVMQLLGDYYTEEIAERELYRRNIANIYGKIGYIADTAQEDYSIKNKSEISLVTSGDKTITVQMEAYYEEGLESMVEYTLKRRDDGNWLITGEKGFTDDGHQPVKKQYLLDLFNTEASSQEENYSSEYAADEDSDTVWAEAAAGDGCGEWLQFTSAAQQKVTGIEIINGYAKSLDQYNQYNRVKKIKIELSDRSSAVFELEDGNEIYQSFDFNKEVSTSYIKITILEVYKGALYDTACISEVRIY